MSHIIKSANDKRLYRLIELENGLKAMLVSSPSEDIADSGHVNGEEPLKHLQNEKTAAAALMVGVGSYQNPDQMPGLAHYLEHMLFMGSSKYPKENAFTEFLYKNGGTENAVTKSESTVFYFDVNEPAFAEALDIFANFFIDPLLREDALDREVQAVESEFQLAVVSDSYRRFMVTSRMAGDDHPMGKFSKGNLRSLKNTPAEQGNNVRQMLIDFYNSYYSADVMTLCVQSKHSLDDLESFVRSSFLAVPRQTSRKQIEYPPGLPFVDNPNFFKLLKIVPSKKTNALILQWILPTLGEGDYKKMSLQYLATLIGHEGKNSILDHLRKKQWALDLSAGFESGGIDNQMCTIFMICIDLACEEGPKHIAEILEYIHQYIHMARKAGPHQWMWEELAKIAEVNFRFEDEIDSICYVRKICQNMQKFASQHYLCSDKLYWDYDPDNIQNMIELLTPERCNVALMCEEFSRQVPVNVPTTHFPLQEQWTGSIYTIEDWPKEWTTKWKDNEEFQIKLEFPVKNRFIADDLSIRKEPENSAFKSARFPEVLEISSQASRNIPGKLWFQKDSKFCVPKSYMWFKFDSPHTKKDIRDFVGINLAIDILRQTLADMTYSADTASLHCRMELSPTGPRVSFRGFNEKLPQLLHEVMDALINFDCPSELFDNVKSAARRIYYNMSMDNRILCNDILSHIVRNNFSISQLRQCTGSMSINDTKETVHRVLVHSFVEAYIHGNLTSAEAKETMTDLNNKLGAKPLCENVEEVFANIKDEKCIRILSYNPEEPSSRITNYYQYGPGHFHEKTLMILLGSLLAEKCFNQLRTEQQLAYDPHLSMQLFRNVLGFSISLSPLASKFSLSDIDARIDAFVGRMRDAVRDMQLKEFDTFRKSLIKEKLRTDLSMYDAAWRNWVQIHNSSYIFDEPQLQVDYLETLTIEQFRKWALKALPSFEEGAVCKKLSIQIVGYGKAALEECEGGDEIWREFEARKKTNRAGNENASESTNEDKELPPLRLMMPMVLSTNSAGQDDYYVSDYESFQKSLSFYPYEKPDPHAPFVI